MRRKLLCLLLAVCLLVALLSACEADGDAGEMTAVTICTEPTEMTAATETTEAAETNANKYTPAQPTALPTEAVTHAESGTQLPDETEAFTEAPSETEAQTEPTDAPSVLAASCIGCEVSILYSVVGYPTNGSRYYAADPNSTAERGELYYDSFTVYTYRENGTEVVVGVGGG